MLLEYLYTILQSHNLYDNFVEFVENKKGTID